MSTDLLAEGLKYVVVGMVVVFATLSILGGLIAMLQLLAGRQPDAPTPVAAARPKTAAVPGATDPKLIAILAAATYVAIGKPVRVLEATPVK